MDNFVLKIWFALIILWGLIFVFVIPPFQKPDEVEHFYRSAGLLYRYKRDGNNIFINKRFFNLPAKLQFSEIRSDQSKGFNWNLLKIRDNDNSLVAYHYDFFGVDFVGYLMSGWGILIGSLFSNPVIAFYLGRLFNFIFFGIYLYLSLKLIPKSFRPILLFYASLPMVIHQASAISYDAIGLALIMMIFSLLVKFVYEEKISLINYLMFIFLLLMFIVTKYGYWFMFLLFWLVPYGKIQIKYKWPVVFGIFAAVVSMLFMSNFLVASMGLRSRIVLGDPVSFQQDIIVRHPDVFLASVGNSLVTMGQGYIESLIGVLGWLDYKLSYGVYLFYIYIYFVLINYLSKRIPDFKFGVYRTIGLFLIMVLIFLSIFAGMFIYEPQPGAKLIIGQGRYFLVMIPFLTLIFVLLFRWIRRYNIKTAGLIVTVILLFGSILYSIRIRYYNGSAQIDKPDDYKISYNRLTDYGKEAPKEKYLVDREFTYNFSFEQKKQKVLGFEFMFTSNKKAVNLPYMFYIRDKSCRGKNLEWGFLDQKQLSNDGVYTHNFQFNTKNLNEICLVLKPYIEDTKANYLSIVREDGGYFIRLLNPKLYLTEEFKLIPGGKFTGEVASDSAIYQTFQPHLNKLKGISLLINNFIEREVKDDYDLVLYEETCKTEVIRAKIDKKKISDGYFVDTWFEVQPYSMDQRYCFSVVPEKDEILTPITLPLASRTTTNRGITGYEFGDLTIKGVKQETDLIFKLLYDN